MQDFLLGPRLLLLALSDLEWQVNCVHVCNKKRITPF